jgi:hypothetical protein
LYRGGPVTGIGHLLALIGLHSPIKILYHTDNIMKITYRYSTVASYPAARPLYGFGAVLIALASPALLLSGCGSGGGGGTPSPSPSAGANQTVITGRVVDINSASAGVAGATVQFAGVSVQTSANGTFSLTVPRNTAGGTATIIAPAGTTLYSYATSSAGCANSLTFSIAGPLSGTTFSVGNISVYSRTASTAPNPPCI